MPLTFCSSFCLTAATATDTIISTTDSRSLHLTTSSASDTSTCSSSLASASSDDNISLQTLPSIPSVNKSLSSSPDSTVFKCATVITSGGAQTALAVTSSFLYSPSESGIAVYDLTSSDQQTCLPIPANTGSVKSIHHDGNKIFTAHQDGRIRVWRQSATSTRHRLLATLPTVSDRLLRLPLPKSYVTIRRHKRLLWIQHADAVSAVTVHNGLIYSVSWDKTLKIWRASDLRCLESVKAHDDAINAVAVAHDGTVYTGSADRRIRVWAKGTGERRLRLVVTLESHVSAVNALALNGDGSVLYSGACDRSILVWEKEESARYMVVVGALRGHGEAIMCLTCVGDLVVSGSSDRTVRVWRRGEDGYSSLAVMEGHLRGVRSLAAMRIPSDEAETAEEENEEYRVCSGSVDGEVRVWRVRVGSCKRPQPELLASLE